MPNINDFQPDFDNIWTVEEAENNLGDSFKFNGPGWYITDTETILVAPTKEVEYPWAQRWAKDKRFYFYFYSERNPLKAFASILQAPVR